MSVDAGYVYFNSEFQQQTQNISSYEFHRARPGVDRLGPNSVTVQQISDGAESDDIQPECIHSSQGIGAPIVDYEIVERKETFTIYRIHVVTPVKNWFVFRRYSDFEKLHKTLRKNFPGFRQKLPKKRWLSDRFDHKFIENRRKGLQLYVNTLLTHDMIARSEYVEDFLCISDPPGPYDSIEESRAFCQQLEQSCEKLKQDVKVLDSELNLTKSQLAQARVQQEVLIAALKTERSKSKKYEHLYKDLENKNTFPVLTEVEWSQNST